MRSGRKERPSHPGKRILLILVGALLCFGAGAAGAAETRLITDMAGRQVRVPKIVTKVLATSPPVLTFVYMLAPEKLKGWMPPGPASGNTAYVPKAYQQIPVIPRGLNSQTYEAYIAIHPDLVIYECEQEADRSRLDTVQSQMGEIPVVAFSVGETRDMSEYAKTVRFIGDLLGASEQAEALIASYTGVLDEVRKTVSALPEKDRIGAYYAEGADGLITDPVRSQHSQLIEVCGGINVADCPIGKGIGRTRVTMESVLMWQPRVIIATDREFMGYAVADSSWGKISAIRDRRVHLIPTQPFNWFDRPPGINRLVGIPWVAHLLYPDHFSEAWLRGRVRDFYSRFYHYDLSDAELAALLTG